MGTVSPAEQRRELFGDQTAATDSSKVSDASTDATEPGAAAAAPKDIQTMKIQ